MKRLAIVALLFAAAFAPAQNPPGPQDATAMQLRLLLQQPPAQVPFAQTQLLGNPGPRTLYYWIVTDATAGSSSPAGPFVIINAPNTLSAPNAVSIFWTAATGGTSYDVLRTSTPIAPTGVCNCAVVVNTSSLSVTDQSESLQAYTLATLDPTSLTLNLNNEPQSPGISHLILRQGNSLVNDLSVGISKTSRGFLNVISDCGLKGSGLPADGATENAALAACMAASPSARFWFPPTNALNNCSYYFASSITPPVGSGGMDLVGGSNSWLNSNTQVAGTVLCFPAGVTGFNLQNCGCTIEYLSLLGSEGTNSLITPALLNIPSGTNLPGWTRNVATIQRTANVLTVTTTRTGGGEALSQQVGSTVKISGVAGDSTMNGLCVIATLTNLSSFGGNASGFTCPQNGSDSGPFGAVGTISLPTTGASTADGIRICNNFTFVNHVTIQNFGRHGINADSLPGHGCTVAFSDDLVLENSTIINNQGSGYYCIGVDCNAHTLKANAFYYNVLWAIEDQSSLGNTHVGNQISNNGHQWAASFTPTSKTISTVSRTLSGADSTVTVVLSQADTTLKLGTCVFIAGVTDSSFNTTTGQCFFITSFTDSTHFQYIQPGAPANASSSGGTERPAMFAEAYLSAGVDSGAEKVGTQSGVAQDVIVGEYTEGGQECKWSPQTIIIGGVAAGCQFSTTDSDFRASIMSGSCTGFGGSLCMSLGAIIQNKDTGGNVNLQAGVTADQTFGFTYLNHLHGIAWITFANPAGTLGGSGSYEIRSGNLQTRFAAFGKDTNNGDTYISAESSSGRILLNFNFAGSNAGQGGVLFCSGGAGSTCPWSVSNAGVATMAAFKSVTLNPASAGAVRLAQADLLKFRNNANTGDLTVLSESVDVLQVGEAVNGIAVAGPATFSSTITQSGSGSITAGSGGFTVGGDSFTAAPRIAWNCFIPGALTATSTNCQFTPKKAITVVQVELAAKTAPVTCTPNAVVRVTDATNNQDTTLTAAQVTNNIAGGQNFAANVAVQVKVQTAEAGCGTSGADVNVTVQYKMQ